MYGERFLQREKVSYMKLTFCSKVRVSTRPKENFQNFVMIRASVNTLTWTKFWKFFFGCVETLNKVQRVSKRYKISNKFCPKFLPFSLHRWISNRHFLSFWIGVRLQYVTFLLLRNIFLNIGIKQHYIWWIESQIGF